MPAPFEIHNRWL